MFNSGFPPLLILLVGFGVLAGFFRKIFGSVIAILVIEIAFFAIFPIALLKFVQLVTSIRSALG